MAIPDHQTQSGLYAEAKFGPSARLSENQKKAFWMDPDDPATDYIFDAPIEAAGLVTGFRGLADTHDPALGAGFELLEPPARPGLFASLGQIFGFGRKG